MRDHAAGGRPIGALRLRTLPAALLALIWLLPADAQTTLRNPKLPQNTPTWATLIAPVLYANCTTCHHPGGAGPFSLLTYRDAVRWGSQMADVTQSHYMPPWLPEHQQGAFADERRLSQADIEQITQWVKASMPEGDLAKAPVAPAYSREWQNGPPDLILKVQQPFLLPASGTDVFRNFVLPYPLKQSRYVRAIEIRPGAPEIVHHANILLDPTASIRRQHPTDWAAGVPGMEVEIDAGNAFDPDGHFLFWKPDSPVLTEPEGMQWKIDPGTDLILNMHLKPSGKAETIFAEVGLYFTDKPPTQQPVLLQLEHDQALDIPAGAHAFPVEDALRLPVAVKLLGIYPHAHYLGHRLEAWATLPGGSRVPLITIPDWDIDRQSVYRYREPLVLPEGTVVHMHYLYDNSDDNVHNPHQPAIRVHAGNRSIDEMAHLWLEVLPIQPEVNGRDARLLLEEAWMRNRISKEPGDGVAEYNLAAALGGEGRYSDAASVYQRLLAKHPEDGRTRNSLGTALEGEGDWQQAQAAYQAAIANDPAGLAGCDARFNLGRLELKHDQAGAAEQVFQAMEARCPEDATVNSGLGAALLAEGRIAASEHAFEHALALDPNDFTALYNLGVLALGAGRQEKAIPLLNQAVRQQPADLDAHQELAEAYAAQGQLTEAIAQLRQVVAIAPLEASGHTALSQALAAAGQIEPATEEQKQALALKAGDADGWNNLGALEARAGDRTSARVSFEHALHLDPGHAQARSNLARLADR